MPTRDVLPNGMVIETNLDEERIDKRARELCSAQSDRAFDDLSEDEQHCFNSLACCEFDREEMAERKHGKNAIEIASILAKLPYADRQRIVELLKPVADLAEGLEDELLTPNAERGEDAIEMIEDLAIALSAPRTVEEAQANWIEFQARMEREEAVSAPARSLN